MCREWVLMVVWGLLFVKREQCDVWEDDMAVFELMIP
jgi:hypothetical protein